MCTCQHHCFHTIKQEEKYRVEKCCHCEAINMVFYATEKDNEICTQQQDDSQKKKPPNIKKDNNWPTHT